MQQPTPIPYHLIPLLALIPLVSASTIRNITITVPQRTTYYQNPDVLCLPASWSDILSFFVANYFAHAATVRNSPGTTSASKISNLITSLLFPAWGLSRAISDILSFSSFVKSDVEAAARAGAFCMVVRSSEWQPAKGESIKHALLLSRVGLEKTQKPEAHRALSFDLFDASWANFELGTASRVRDQNIHGSHHLPAGYALIVVPRHARVERLGAAHGYAEIKSNYNPAKTLVAIVQLLYAMTTIYESRVHQIDRFGYAAFGLTVAPYAVMSFVNLVAGLFCPDFEELYLVNSSVLEEARSRPDAQFGAVAGDLVEYEDGSVVAPDTWMGAKVANVDATFWLDEKTQQRSASVTRLARNHGKMVRKDDKSQSIQSSLLPVTETATSQPIRHTDDVDHTEEHYLVFENRQTLEASGHSADTFLLIPCCAPFKATVHPAKRLLSTFRTQKQDKNCTDLIKFNPDKDGVLLNYSLTDISAFLIALTAYGAIIGIIAGISRFRNGDSTLAQRIWTMTWLAIGLAYFVFFNGLLHVFRRCRGLNQHGSRAVVYALASYVPAAPAIGGLVVVGQMLWGYGSCTTLS